MYKEDSLRFAQERLRHHGAAGALGREWRLRPTPRVTRRFAAEMAKGDSRTFERVDSSVVICCNGGTLWITHDGDPKDVFVFAGDCYRAQREDAMHLYAMTDCCLEIEFEDDVVQH